MSSGCTYHNTNGLKGLCSYSFVSGTTCVASCTTVTEYLITANNDKVCGQVGCATANTVDETPLSLAITCAACSGAKPNKLGVFCVDSCINYFNAHCTALATVDNTGECQRPIVENNVCMVTTVNTVKLMGDSRDYLGCTPGMYLLNFVCVACN